MGKAESGLRAVLGDSKREIWGQREMLSTSENNFNSILEECVARTWPWRWWVRMTMGREEQSPREPQLQGFYAERASQHRHSLGVGVLKVININYAAMKRGGIGCGRECRAVESSSLM